MSGIFDSHSHYDDARFDEDRDSLLLRILSQNVELIMTCGTTIETSEANKRIAEKYKNVYFAAGIHPECVENCPQNYTDLLRPLLAHEKCRAVGEVGLDYSYEIPKGLQLRIFEEQIILANELNMPVIVHDREAHADTFELLCKYMPRGVVHCYSGSVEMAKEYVKRGFYVGVTGIVTFKNSRKVKELAEWIPLEYLLLETDAPYLAPVPFRGRRNDSSLIEYTAAEIAQIRGVTAQKITDITNENARRLFGV